MKRFCAATLALLVLFSFCACTGHKLEDAILSHLNLPLEADCSFVFGELDGRGRLCLTEESLSLGITDGALRGLVISAEDENVRFLYEGMDLSFSADTTQIFRLLKEAFKFLSLQSYHPNNAETVPEGLQFTFVDAETDTTLSYSVRHDGTPMELVLTYSDSTLCLNFIENRGNP